jgi:protein-S-isoprenylcysteine O-methyltransferase Ste14
MDRADCALHSTPDLNAEVKRRNRWRLAASLAAAPFLVWLVLFTARPKLAPGLMRSIGFLAMAGGIGLRLWAIGCIGGRKKRVLVTWGPYRHVRHPLYCGSLLLALGACVFAGAPAAGLVTGLVFLALYLPSLRAEERFLAERFGHEWDAYRSCVAAFFPNLAAAWPCVQSPSRRRWPIRHLIELGLLCLAAIGASEWMRRLAAGNEPPSWLF